MGFEEFMRLDIKTKDRLAVIKINESELISSFAPELKTELLRLVSEGYINIIANLKKVSYVDSSGLSALLFGRRQVTSANGNLKLCCISDEVMEMIKIAQLNRVFDILGTEKEAIESFSE